MRYRITGVNRQLGTDVSISVEAVSASAAEKAVNDKGILVESVRPEVSSQIESEAIPDVMPSPSKQGQRGEQVKSTDAGLPEYRSLVNGASVLWLLGLLCYVIGTVGMILGLVMILHGSPPAEAAQLVIGGGLLFIYGALIQTLGGAAQA